MNSNLFTGVFTALITPFKAGHVDFDSLGKLLRQQLDAGVQGFVVNGTTAESPTLKEDERWSLLSFVQSQVARQVPIVMGTGTFSTEVTIDQTQKAEKAGADGALIVVPYYNKPPQAGLVAHFSAVAAATKLPILLYNVPGRTVASLSVESIATLAKIPNIIGIKEATGDVALGKEIAARVDRSFIILSGDDGTYLDLTTVGGHGVISVLSHVIPGACRQLLDQVRAGKDVRGEFEKYKNLVALMFQEANPIPVKTMLKMMGVIATDDVRLPLVRTSEKLQTQIQAELKKLSLI